MLTILKDIMKYYKLFIEFFLVSLIVSEILESAKLPASAKLPFLPLLLSINQSIRFIYTLKVSMKILWQVLNEINEKI